LVLSFKYLFYLIKKYIYITLQDEHFAILQKKLPGERMNWDDYKNMSQTRAVDILFIYELDF